MKNSNLTRLFSTAAVLGVLAMPTVADEHEGIHLPGASAEITMDYVSQYIFRGVEQPDSDNIGAFHPGASMTLPVVETDEMVLSGTIGTWLAIIPDTGPPTTTDNPSSWYEADIYASLDAEIGDFTATVGLTYYTYPSAAANGDITELNLKLEYDDSDLLGDYSFTPYVELAIELQNNSASVPADERTYLGLGGAFEVDMNEIYDAPIVWTVPINFGLSLDDYYTDAAGAEEFFGYASIGLMGTIPMSELIGTEEYVGAWDLTAGFTVYFLNSQVAMTDDTNNTSDNMQFVASVGLSRSW